MREKLYEQLIEKGINNFPEAFNFAINFLGISEQDAFNYLDEYYLKFENCLFFTSKFIINKNKCLSYIHSPNLNENQLKFIKYVLINGKRTDTVRESLSFYINSGLLKEISFDISSPFICGFIEENFKNYIKDKDSISFELEISEPKNNIQILGTLNHNAYIPYP